MRYLIPIATGDDLFPRDEYHFPKPLIEIDGQPMISRVIENIEAQDPVAEFIFVVRSEDCRQFSLDRALRESTKGPCNVIALESPTAGAACSALMAVDLIDDDGPLVVCNGDQIIEDAIKEALTSFKAGAAGAGVITFASVHPRWSFVRVDTSGDVLEAAEKRVISRHAIAGFYYFRSGQAFVRAAQRSILNQDSVNGRYYIAPLLNQFVLDGERVAQFPIRTEQYQSLFSPQRLESYERQVQTRRLMANTATKPVTVVIPMAGLGSRFANAGYDKPKPFIDVSGATMISRVMDNLNVKDARFVLVARREHLDAHPETVQELEAKGNVTFAPIDFVTEGACCTVLLSHRLIGMDAPLLIANCDQIVDFDCEAFVRDASERRLDGSILVFRDAEQNVKWSFAKVGASGLVEETREKVPISDLATVGLYYFASARTFIDAAIDMIARNDRVNNEFYVCPVYNYAVASGARIGVYEIPHESMHGIGTPNDLTAFMKHRYLL